MAESQLLSVIRVWAAVAWADGVLVESEADGIRKLVRASELSVEERVAAARFLETKVGLPETTMHNLNPEARRGIYRAACRMAVVDHVFAHSERKMLDKLQTLLGIPSEIAIEIEADVPGVEV